MHSNKQAITAAPIAPVLASRWSPRSFDRDYLLTQDEALAILEAGRWAPSSNNLQPWRFAYVSKTDKLHKELCEKGLTGFNQSWAPDASALIVVAVKKATADGKELTGAKYDAGLAASMMLVQAQEMGLHTHHIGGIVRDEIHQMLNLDDNTEVLVVIAVGKIAPAEQLEGPAYEREVAPRVRLELDEIMLYGKP
ncbi:MAG: nitroreductase [Micrococcales bacterium]|nr:nitroreductase [Micrococcales bacterium]NBR55070.1 nitroreductase [Micrococcales bacterium]NBR61328.1 nitroreductase [Actinomycetota bacterium]NBT47917.1 nitroreductase [Actinomycetota bacterium]NBY43364.1 nitroreductase [Micrococcales bacterium]